MVVQNQKSFVIIILLCVFFSFSCGDKNKTSKPAKPLLDEVSIKAITFDDDQIGDTKIILENYTEKQSYIRTTTTNQIICPVGEYGTYTVIIRHSRHGYLFAPLMVQESSVYHLRLFNDKIKIGDDVNFGGSSWNVLGIHDTKALLITKNVINLEKYHTSKTSITWVNSSLRTYLNGALYNSSTFNHLDRHMMASVTNTNENNQCVGTNRGAPIEDKIFILHLSEVAKYFGDSEQLTNSPHDKSYWINDEYNAYRLPV